MDTFVKSLGQPLLRFKRSPNQLEILQVQREDVVKALKLKSFDYRVLNLLMFSVRDNYSLVVFDVCN